MIEFFRRQTANAKDDTLSGLTVALALVPEAVAFAFVAGVSPLIGLYSAFFMGAITAILGGRPGMISGATGAMAVVVTSLVAMHGVGYLFYAVILAGCFQITVGLLKLGKLIRLVPHSVMLGFVNGLAIVIGLAQLGSFKRLGESGTLEYMTGTPLIVMLVLVVVTMAIIWGLPKLTRAVPSSLVAILTVSLAAAGLNAWISGDDGNVTPTVRDMLVTNSQAKEVREFVAAKTDTSVASLKDEAAAAGLMVVPVADEQTVALSTDEMGLALADFDAAAVGLKGGLPLPFFLDPQYIGDEVGAGVGNLLPPVNFATLWIILPFAAVLAGVGLIESLMTMTLIDEITETRGRGNRECVGQGIANVTSGLFGGMGGCAMIGQSLINVNSGGRGRLSGIVAAVMLLLFVLVLAPLIELIPMAALVGVMFMVVIGTFEWATLKMWKKVPPADIFVMLLVTLYTVFMHDLATAVILGVAVSALVFAWRHATHLGVDIKYNEFGSKIYQLHGALFFGSVTHFADSFDPKHDPEDVVVDFYYTRVYDQSGLEAINKLADRYEAEGKRLHLTHLSEECRQLLDRAGEFVEVNMSEDPQYHVATDRLG
ncbi:MAG: SulP family inorganic anion transporter [Planctomycetota bacterium]